MQHQVDRFYSAVLVLAGDGHIKQRLISAYEKNIDGISEDELPRELKDNFLDLKSQLHSVSPLNGEGAVCATVRKMSADEASVCARKLLALYAELLKSRPGSDDEAAEKKGDAKAAKQPVLVKSVG